MVTSSPSGRLATLDALRGLASMTVVFSHALHVLPTFGDRHVVSPETLFSTVAKMPLIFTFVNGHPAVMVFFVLSGLVLARPLLSASPPGYAQFALKRTLRIYPPYVAALLLSAFAQALLGNAVPRGPSPWLLYSWTDHPTLGVAADYIFMGGNTVALDNPVWTLDYEMRLSFLLPFLLLPIRFYGQITGLVLAGALLIGGEKLSLDSTVPIWICVGRTSLYGGMFVLGALLSQNTGFLQKLRPGLPSLVCACLGWLILSFFWQENLLGIGASLLIVSVVAPGPLARFCEGPVPQFLGRISFSLYLVHVPILMCLLALTAGHLPQEMVVAILPVVAIGGAWIFYRCIEAPSHALGQTIWLGKRLFVPIIKSK